MSKPTSALTSLASFDSVDAPIAVGADRGARRLSQAISQAFSAHLLAIVVACTGIYAAVAALYVLRLPLIADEFDGAYDVHLLASKLPYADFKPYKTVLGYYLELPPLLLAHSVWDGLLGTKFMLTACNAVATIAAAMLAARRFSARAVVLALPMWLCMSDWVERSSELRVDALTSWAGLFGLFALLASRPALAGLLTGISFLVSQKGLYFLPSAVAGLAAILLLGDDRRANVGALGRFCIAYALTVLAYVGFWGAISSWRSTSNATFLAHRAIVFDDIYPHIRRFWLQSLRRNPFFYAATVASLLALGRRVLADNGTAPALRGGASSNERGKAAHSRDAILFGYAAIFATCVLWHKQPWPYFFVMVVPTAFVVVVWAIECAWSGCERFADRPRARGWIAFLPLTALLAVCLLGGVQPALRVRKVLRLNNDYQHHMLTLASALVGPNEYYLAALDLLYTRTQSSAALRRVSLARRRELSHRPRIASVEILTDLHDRPPKVLIRNDRFDSFPKAVNKYLRDNYTHFWGSIDLYAPRVRKGGSSIELLFPGEYRWTSKARRPAIIGADEVSDGTTLTLPRGQLEIKSAAEGRLVLQAPGVKAQTDPRFRRQRGFFGDSYGR
jgi:hypothetical protein